MIRNAPGLIVVTVLCWQVQAWAATPMLDVPNQQPVHTYVNETVSRYQMLSVYPDGTFRGDLPFTRYELAVTLNDLVGVLQNRFKIPLSPIQSAMMDFSALLDDNGGDLSMQHWAAEAVSNVVNRGLMSGYPDMTFRGKQKVSRYELAVQLEKLMQNLGLADSSLDAVNPDLYQPIADLEQPQGGDLKSDHWAYKPTLLVLQKGLMYGKQRSFAGDQLASRYDLAIALASLVRILEKKNSPPVTSNPAKTL